MPRKIPRAALPMKTAACALPLLPADQPSAWARCWAWFTERLRREDPADGGADIVPEIPGDVFCKVAPSPLRTPSEPHATEGI